MNNQSWKQKIKHLIKKICHKNIRDLFILPQHWSRYLSCAATFTKRAFNIVDDSLIKNTIACGGELTLNNKQAGGKLCSISTGSRCRLYFIHLFFYWPGRGNCRHIGPAACRYYGLTKPWLRQSSEHRKKLGSQRCQQHWKPTSDLVKQSRKATANKEIELKVFCAMPLRQLMSGDAATHDKIWWCIKTISEWSGCNCIGQASMARGWWIH